MKEKIKIAITLLIIFVGLGIVMSLISKYQVEGESNMPYNIKEILIVSSAEAQGKSENPENLKWNLNINQFNDFYLVFDVNEKYKKQSKLEEISIENINISNKPKVGNIDVYMPSSREDSGYKYNDEFKVNGSLTYKSGLSNDSKNLELSQRDGMFKFRVVNQNIGEYTSNEDDEISYDGKLLSKINLTEDNIKFNISFDIVIKTDKNTFRGKFKQDLPISGLIEKGQSNLDIKDCSNIIFKRE